MRNGEPTPPCGATAHTDCTSVQFYDDRYRRGYMETWPEAKKQRVRDLVASLPLPAVGTALDFGCGQGVFTQVLAEALPRWTVVGTDISETALDLAARRAPRITFATLADLSTREGAFDFLFTHHVLEHIADLDRTADQISSYVRPQGSMFRIPPCGNPGSLEHRICALREDGIARDGSGRFCYEDDGHMRRMQSGQLEELFSRNGFRVAASYCANQFWGALQWMSAIPDIRFLSRVTNSRYAVNHVARLRLLCYRTLLTTLRLLRKPVAFLKTQSDAHSLGRHKRLLLAGTIVASPFSILTETFLARSAQTEWTTKRHVMTGSEMYLYFVRQ